MELVERNHFLLWDHKTWYTSRPHVLIACCQLLTITMFDFKMASWLMFFFYSILTQNRFKSPWIDFVFVEVTVYTYNIRHISILVIINCNSISIVKFFYIQNKNANYRKFWLLNPIVIEVSRLNEVIQDFLEWGIFNSAQTQSFWFSIYF